MNNPEIPNIKLYQAKILELNNNLLLTKRKGGTGKHWPEIVAVWTDYRKVL